MADLLVRLFSLPDLNPLRNELQAEGIVIRRAHPSEAEVIASWVCYHFNEKWAAECKGALSNRPPSCFLATDVSTKAEADEDPYNLPPEKLVGFACYDSVAIGMFGPEGVQPDYQGRGIGKALLLACMYAMADFGYAYAIIAWAGPIDFYKKSVGATIIENSEPGIFRGPLTGEEG
jgi:GNAT superfamily N-acetyltransferase